MPGRRLVSDQDQYEDAPPLWSGTCDSCATEWRVPDDVLRERYPDNDHQVHLDGAFVSECTECGGRVVIERSSVKVVPFAAMHVLPPESGCSECGREHDEGLPHDLQSMVYQYAFRNRTAREGDERWPTWLDAMAHCTPATRGLWISAMREHGIQLDVPEDFDVTWPDPEADT